MGFQINFGGSAHSGNSHLSASNSGWNDGPPNYRNNYSPSRNTGRNSGGMWIMVAVCLIFAIVGGFFAFVSYHDSKTYTAQTTGTITNSPDQSAETDCSSSTNGRGSDCDVHYKCSFAYKYTVDGVKYNPSTVESNACGSKQKGSEIAVYYDPENPSKSITHNPKSRNFMTFILFVPAVFLLGWGVRKFFKNKKNSSKDTGPLDERYNLDNSSADRGNRAATGYYNPGNRNKQEGYKPESPDEDPNPYDIGDFK